MSGKLPCDRVSMALAKLSADAHQHDWAVTSQPLHHMQARLEISEHRDIRHGIHRCLPPYTSTTIVEVAKSWGVDVPVVVVRWERGREREREC